MPLGAGLQEPDGFERHEVRELLAAEQAHGWVGRPNDSAAPTGDQDGENQAMARSRPRSLSTPGSGATARVGRSIRFSLSMRVSDEQRTPGWRQPNVWHQRRAQRVRCMPGLDLGLK